VIDVSALWILLLVSGWLEWRERDTIAYLIASCAGYWVGRRLRLIDAERRRVAALAYRLGRHIRRDVATAAAPDTLHKDGAARADRVAGPSGARSDRVPVLIGHSFP
jgi:hypothetical protein